MNTYLNDMMAFADLLAACNVIHEEAVTDADGYDGGITMCRIAEVHRRLKDAEPKPLCGWRGRLRAATWPRRRTRIQRRFRFSA